MGNQIINRMLKLKSRPMMNDVSSENFELVEEKVRDIEEGEILVKNLYLSFDPTQRGWLNDVPSYIPPVQIGEVMRAGSVGKVIESKNQNFSEDDIVQVLLAGKNMPFLVKDQVSCLHKNFLKVFLLHLL